MTRVALVVAAASAVFMLQASCARTPHGELEEPVLFSPDAGPITPLACVETVCPPPYATCPDQKGGPCTTNLRNDVDHCGACGNACPKPADPSSANGRYVCSEGVCRLACAPLHADCNNSTADGCEVATESDPENCGFCKNKCDDGVLCWKGACGCPNGFTQCGEDCKNLQADDDNCSACGNKCRAPTDPTDPHWICGPDVTPTNTKWTCANADCKLLCKPGWDDCNASFCGDGCETDLLNDPNNCGACGHKCNFGQTCSLGACLCPEGLTNCKGKCVDLDKDPNHCGWCGHRCPGPSSTRPGQQATGSPACEGGECTYVCYPGWADCDQRIGNGCEANLNTDQKNCGACDATCDVGAKQPCVEGRCLTKPCETGPGDPVK